MQGFAVILHCSIFIQGIYLLGGGRAEVELGGNVKRGFDRSPTLSAGNGKMGDGTGALSCASSDRREVAGSFVTRGMMTTKLESHTVSYSMFSLKWLIAWYNCC